MRRGDNLKTSIFLFLSLSLLCGCSVGKYSYSRVAQEKVDMTFTGIPTILGLGTLGTTIPITKNFSLTAAHVADWTFNKIKSRHPFCDLAIIYHNNRDVKKFPIFRNGNISDRINMYGYSFISAMPVASSGTNLINTHLINKWNSEDCIVVASDAGVVQGMSGGAVYNNIDGTLAGVIIGYARKIIIPENKKILYENVSLYIPYAVFQQWLESQLII